MIIVLILLVIPWTSLALLHSTVRTRSTFLAAENKIVESAALCDQLETSISKLKRVLTREYTTFFNPMEREWYSSDVTFQDPLTSLSGVDSYQNNVDLLSGRTLLGSLLFSDASIILHSITGGVVALSSTNNQSSLSISDITTRWTLRFRFKILPWKPTAVFSGISVYKVVEGGPQGVQILKQNDYWDSINLQSDGSYKPVDKSVGLTDFLDQLKPSDLRAPSAAPELPYILLRRGQGYEIRRYPGFNAAKIKYERRDEGFSLLGSYTQGMNPLSPAIMSVYSDGSKSMMWPLSYDIPGKESVAPTSMPSGSIDIVSLPSAVVAVRRFSDASVEPVVRRTLAELRNACERDGLDLQNTGDIVFCQYDAIFSMGKRRGEVWIPLSAAHPWSS